MRKCAEIWLAWTVCIAGLAPAAPLWALEEDEALGFERTPPRLSFADGEVSLLARRRRGVDAGAPNIALAPGDELWTAAGANLELQIDARTYVRAGEETQLGLSSLEPDYIQLRVTTGHVSLDVRSRKIGQTVEIATPNAAFSIEHTGYYRVEVDGDTTSLISRRGGRATRDDRDRRDGDDRAERAGRGDAESSAAGRDLRRARARRLGPLELRAHRRPARCRLARATSRPACTASTTSITTATGASFRPTAPCGCRAASRSAGRRTAPAAGCDDPYYGWTWVDDARLGLGAVPLRALGPCLGILGLGAGSDRRCARTTRRRWSPSSAAAAPRSASASARRTSDGWRSAGASPLMPWWGPVGCRGVPRWAGWRRAAHRQQRRRDEHDRDQRARDQRLPERARRRARSLRWIASNSDAGRSPRRA